MQYIADRFLRIFAGLGALTRVPIALFGPIKLPRDQILPGQREEGPSSAAH